MLHERSGFGFPSAERAEIKSPKKAVVEAIALLIRNEGAPPASPVSEEGRTWLGIFPGRVKIQLAEFLRHLRYIGARSGSDVGEASRHPEPQEARMEHWDQSRLKAELQALQELSKQAPASSAELDELVGRRKTEFDEAWRIDADKPNDPYPLRLIK